MQIIRAQPVAKQTSMATWFKNLMDGIERNLLTKNRDRQVPPSYMHFFRFGNSADLFFSPDFYFRFTQNLSVFRRDINDSLKGPNVATTTVNDMMTS